MIHWNNLHQTSQGWDLDKGDTLTIDGEEFDVAYEIHHDTSYPKQSTASIHVWVAEEMRWQLLQGLLASAWAFDKDPSDANATQGLWSAALELEARACALLQRTVESRRSIILLDTESPTVLPITLVEFVEWVISEMEDSTGPRSAKNVAQGIYSNFRDDNGFEVGQFQVDGRWATIEKAEA